jgi:hypothetical protein
MAKNKRQETSASNATEVTPQEVPPSEEAVMAGAEEARPSEILSEEELQAYAETEAMPREAPPDTEEAVSEAFGVTWHRNKKITALWSINQNRNSWIGVSGLRWKKLANNSNSAVVALTMLASHAKQMNCSVNIKEDSGQIKEMYVW